MNLKRSFTYVCLVLLTSSISSAIKVNAQAIQQSEVYSTDFENGSEDWKFVDMGWAIAVESTTPEKTDQKSKEKTSTKESKPAAVNHVLSQHTKKSEYKPPFRSPFHMALLKEKTVTDFQLDVRVHSTHKDYPHRDACLFFGYQNPSQFYYVHLGKKGDDHANQIFIVNKAARTKISLTTTVGTPWTDNWHNVRITRNIESGDIKVYFDDMDTAAMTANDKTFTWGQVGMGTFDDTADFDDFKLTGKLVDKVVDDSVKEPKDSTKGSGDSATKSEDSAR
ncbi:MAG: hypothetical protein AB8B55_11940 [Mariniblastus sp.]